MQLESLSLRNLRGYAELDAAFGSGPHLVHGPNAAGKTSLLEAVVLLSWGHSHRTTTDAELIRWGADFTRVEGRIRRASADATAVEVTLAREEDGWLAEAYHRTRIAAEEEALAEAKGRAQAEAAAATAAEQRAGEERRLRDRQMALWPAQCTQGNSERPIQHH